MKAGARLRPDGSVGFSVWAPRVSEVALRLPDEELSLPMERAGNGYFTLVTDRAGPGSRYLFRTGGIDYPDPASVSQPEGVHRASEVVDFSVVEWSDDAYRAVPLARMVMYELHVGAFTPEGTFAAAARRLTELADLGFNAVEVMPIAEFAGNRNWGYDGVSWFAAESTYGGPIEFCRFVDVAHEAGVAVILDLVFNHFGPEGNYSGQFGDYTTDRYRTPWGDAINLDGPGSDEVRTFMRDCVDHWMRDCHVDGFRLDAVHEIHDESAVPFLGLLTDYVHAFGAQSGKARVVIAESDLNDRRLVETTDSGGRGMDAAWADDFHHALHSVLTGERQGYYEDFGEIEQLARAIERGWCYSWDYAPSRRRHHGNDPHDLPGRAFVFCTQNHDQVGNRMLGDRLRSIAGLRAERAGRALLLLAPYVPLLFMGQEYGEQVPFLYFVDHTDPDLLAATREGRRREFAAFHAAGTAPDPGARSTRDRSVLDWNTAGADREMTRTLLQLRRAHDCFRPADEGEAEVARRVWTDESCLILRLSGASSEAIVLANLAPSPYALVPSEVMGSALSGVPAGLPEVVFTTPECSFAAAVVDVDAPVELGAFDLVAAVWIGGRHE